MIDWVPRLFGHHHQVSGALRLVRGEVRAEISKITGGGTKRALAAGKGVAHHKKFVVRAEALLSTLLVSYRNVPEKRGSW